MKPIIAVGHSALDDVYRIAEFPRTPTKLRALAHRASGGGMAANAAATIGMLGGRVALWSRIGDDPAGRIVRDQLREAHVDTTWLRTCPGAKTPTSAVIVDRQGERMIVSEDDHALPMQADWLPLSEIANAAVVISDLTWLEGTRAAFAEARVQGVPTLLDIDLGSGQLLEHVIGLTDYAIFSAPAFHRFVAGSDDQARLKSLIAKGVRHAGVTLGADGYRWIDRDGNEGRMAAVKVQTVDTTGAGDAFHGAFAWALAQGKHDADCARIASAAAALSCRCLGARAGLPTRDALEDVLIENSG